MKTFKLTRVSFVLKELWNTNKWLIVSILPVMIILFWLYYMWPNSIYHPYFNTYSGSGDWRAMTIINSNKTSVVILLAIIPVYLYLGFNGYLKRLKTDSFTVLTPVSAIERVISIWVFGLGFAFILLSAFFLTDYLFCNIHQALFLEETIKNMESNGDLYYNFGNKSVFSSLSQNDVLFWLIWVISAFVLPILFLVAFQIRKVTILAYPVLSILVFFLLFPYIPYFIGRGFHLEISNTPLFWIVYSVFLLVIHVLWMASFYFSIKENQV